MGVHGRVVDNIYIYICLNGIACVRAIWVILFARGDMFDSLTFVCITKHTTIYGMTQERSCNSFFLLTPSFSLPFDFRGLGCL
jgi:hypothetical protein